MPKIFCANRSGHDFSPALDYGEEIIYLTEGEVKPYRVNAAYRQICRRLEGSSPDDLILQTGLPMLNVVAAAVFARKHGRLNLLLFKKQRGQGRYIKQTLNVDELLERKGHESDEV